MSKRKLTYEDFKRYFFNRQKTDEKHQFEKEMMQDAFEEEAFDGLSMLSEEEFEKDITLLKNRIHQRAKKRNRVIPLYMRYAAGIAILIGIGLTSLYVFDKQVKDDLKFAEPVHETMALSNEEKPDEEKNALEKEKQEIKKDNDENNYDNKSIEKTELTKPSKSQKSIDNLSVPLSDDQFDLETETGSELAEPETTPEITIEEEEETIIEVAQEQHKEEKLAEETPVGGIQNVRNDEKEITQNRREEKGRNRLFSTNKAKKSSKTVQAESSTEDAMPQSQAFSIQQNANVTPPNNWIMDTLESKLVREIKKRYDLADNTYKIDMELIINTNGGITQIIHNKEIPESLKSTIQSILNSFGKWQPAIKNGQVGASEIKLKFKIK
jgi:hypothetical protein